MHVRMYVCTYAYMYVCTYVCIYACIYVRHGCYNSRFIKSLETPMLPAPFVCLSKYY